MDLSSDDDDARATELETLEAIYPELRRPDAHGFAFELELPVEPAAAVTVTFPAASDAQQQGAVVVKDSLQVSHLPPLSLSISLPDDYPATCPLLVKISTTPPWLSAETLARLEDEGPRLWEEMGRDLVAYAYIDHVQRAADDVFGAITAEGTLEVDPEHKLAVLDYDIKAKRAAFEKETFNCGICLDPKKGSRCHRMLDCKHIFCLQCLQDFYNDAIKDGNLSTVRCLAPNCAKERAAASVASMATTKVRKPKTFINPSELLQIGLSEDMVRRYVNLKYKTELESDKNTIYCPRQWCNGAARSTKRKKPSGLEFTETPDVESDKDDDDTETGDDKRKKKKADKFNRADLLAVCEDCGLAFCSRCYQSWHGEFVHCTPRRENGELTEEDKASMDYLKLHTSPCPTCSAPAQKTHGCNHMICSRCDTHFCYLCSAWLDPGNPYRHYNEQPGGKFTSCYMRLWELEGGDGDDVGLGFVGGGGPVANQPEEEAEEWPIEIEEADSSSSSSDSESEDDDNAARQLDENGERVAVAREAPLVLRLMDNNRGRGGRLGVGQVEVGGQRIGNHLQNEGGDVVQQAGRARGRGGRRARGGGGGGGGGAAAGGGPARQNQNQQRPQQAAAAGQRDDHPAHNDDDDDGLDAVQEAWVRHFVHMALLDAEDEVEGGDSDEDHDRWVIR